MEDKSSHQANDNGEAKNSIDEHSNQIIEQLKSNKVELQQTAVRVRQKTCTFNEVKKDELPSFAPGWKVQRRMTLHQMKNRDQQDPSLQKYKKDLIGEVDDEEVAQQKTTEVEIIKIEIVCKDRPEGNIILDFTNQNVNEKETFIIKEGSVYFMRVYFRVRYDIVFGLKFVNNVYRHFMKVDKYEEKMGCFPPKKEIQQIDLDPEEAPSGFLGRGSYKGKIMFVDNDGIVHMQFEYLLKICKKWTD
ncbi:Rho GDP-dissociation inhibitor, putative (macronuclear) [Tetrahymena thermophila SB210]|uniref:Rho GDP-dissociation inhibitor, putative n=1 Tax=Tetrahymena thermophila (strain SB210) TaxID=312017 RepID=I7MMT4_TETTS|nr:Rho GDP-dissociation inhibitor, putative [Tetrahymena thermophila SB210]EAS06706.2 Rho GDP-dissociation inhibitor, putative [Tetrahymena thermophila SB210]|eukprot:XP_001026948.2 Rho GDP-dissociation inhibitor, putative [Tetrahymena thermophila SB210]